MLDKLRLFVYIIDLSWLAVPFCSHLGILFAGRDQPFNRTKRCPFEKINGSRNKIRSKIFGEKC